MQKNKFSLASILLYYSLAAITLLSIAAIFADPKQAKEILAMVLPVISAWVGTVLAFYFGKDNFESANIQAREMMAKLSPKERESSLIISIMRQVRNITSYQISSSTNINQIKLEQFIPLYKGFVSRLPILNDADVPLYMLHKSSIDRYLGAGGKSDNSLQELVEHQQKEGHEFGLNQGFVIVSKNTAIKDAKALMQKINSCQDIFITENGNEGEALLGWVSNVRLTKYINS